MGALEMIKAGLILLFSLIASSCAEEGEVNGLLEQCKGISVPADSANRHKFKGFAVLYDLGPVGKVVDIIPSNCQPCTRPNERIGFCAFHYGKFELDALDSSLVGVSQSNRIAHLPRRDDISRVFRVSGSAEVKVTNEGISLSDIEFDSSEEVAVGELSESFKPSRAP